jgi:hypothetical protein
MTTSSDPDAARTFEATIRPLFREKDRQSMLEVFDLWSYPDVRAHQDAILTAVSTGKMPCDGVWPGADVEEFRSWIAAGSPR